MIATEHTRHRAALDAALARFGKPEMFNPDQGGQFTLAAFTAARLTAGIPVSIDGRGRWLDNVFIGCGSTRTKHHCGAKARPTRLWT